MAPRSELARGRGGRLKGTADPAHATPCSAWSSPPIRSHALLVPLRQPGPLLRSRAVLGGARHLGLHRVAAANVGSCIVKPTPACVLAQTTRAKGGEPGCDGYWTT